jgi:hypothetical protein
VRTARAMVWRALFLGRKGDVAGAGSGSDISLITSVRQGEPLRPNVY